MSAPTAPSRLTPQEAALRGASLAFQKQQQQQQQTGNGGGGGNNNNGRLSRQTTGSVSGSTGGGGGRISRQTTGSVAGDERERERQALFLPPSNSADQLGWGDGGGGGGPYHQYHHHHNQHLAPPGARAAGAVDPKSASFIAATLAASRSASPASRVGGGVGGENGAGGRVRRSPLREPVDVSSRRSSAAGQDAEEGQRADTTSLRPAMSLISLFESQRRAEGDAAQAGGRRQQQQQQLRSTRSEARLGRGADEDENREGLRAKSRPSPKPKPKVKAKPKVQQVSRREETPPPPVFRRADTEIVSPRPRRPEKKPALEEATSVSTEPNENPNVSIREVSKAKPKKPKPRAVVARSEGAANPGQEENETISAPTKTRPPAPRKSGDLSGRVPFELRTQNERRLAEAPSTDGQVESKTASTEDVTDARPPTADSKSSNDSFVSASSVPTRDETDSLLTVRSPTPSSLTPRLRPTRPMSTQPQTPVLPLRRSATGSSSQLPLDSLSDAIMAGALASARHTPVPPAPGSAGRTPPPPVPPSRRSNNNNKQQKGSSRRSSPHRMKHTLRQPHSLSDDEEARRPHNRHHHRGKPGGGGLHSKKHAHHEGSRRRWREEITEREKKRYEAVWASNRGLFLVRAAPGPTTAAPVVRDEGYEARSELVASVVVRDLWTRSRLPAAELAEVWDLVYGQGQRRRALAPGLPPGYGHAALDKQEFVVGMWLIDQRLRGRKIPPRVGESVWESAKGLRVLEPEKHGHGHGHKGKGKGK